MINEIVLISPRPFILFLISVSLHSGYKCMNDAAPMVIDLRYILYYKLDDGSSSPVQRRNLIHNRKQAKGGGMMFAFAKMKDLENPGIRQVH